MTDQDNMNINKNSIVTLREVTKENLWDIFALEVASEQSRYVATNEIKRFSSVTSPAKAVHRVFMKSSVLSLPAKC
jgi:hypothetical protein